MIMAAQWYNLKSLFPPSRGEIVEADEVCVLEAIVWTALVTVLNTLP